MKSLRVRLKKFFAKTADLREDQTFALTTSVAIVCLPHFTEMPWWCGIVAVLALSLRYLSDLGRPWLGIHFPKPSLRVLYVVCLGVTYLTYKHFGTLQGPEPSTSLLVMLMCLKLLESRTYRDAMVVFILSYFVAMTWLLFSQSIPSTLYLLFAMLYSTSSLMSLHAPKNFVGKSFSFAAFKDLAKAVPVFVLMFFLFPRFASPFAGMGLQNNTGTGFSGDLNPGEVASLTRSEETAFRVRFANDVRPTLKNLYWRGSVLSQYKGLAWKRASKPFRRTLGELPQHTIEQEILVEPRFNSFLFGLDRPIAATFGSSDMRFPIRISDDLELRSPVRLAQATLVKVSSGNLPFEPLTKRERSEYLKLNEELSPAVKSFSEDLRRGAQNNLEVASRVLKHFRTTGFVYSIEPGVVEDIDNFLFKAKKGFCEHYAASFSTLMRAAGVPSRVVVGFYGGIYNEFGNYVIVRDRDAHAWSEIWIENEGWRRIDPTTSVSPDRIRADDVSVNRDIASSAARQLTLTEKIQMAFDYADSEYTLFLLSFDSARQMEMLDELGFHFSNKWDLVFLCVSLIMLMATLIALFTRVKAAPRDPVSVGYSQLTDFLSRQGVKISPSMGPYEVLQAAQKNPSPQAREIASVIGLYVQTRYGKDHSQKFLKALKDINTRSA